MTQLAVDDLLARLWDELLTVPEDHLGEIVAGEIRLTPRPGPQHLRAAAGLGTLLGGPFGFGVGGPGGWVVLAEPRVRFLDDVRAPDLAAWRAERYAEPERGPYTVVPDFCCEILSPSTAADDRGEKQPLYARAGVRHLWLMDPAVKTLEVLRLEGDLWVVVHVFTGDAIARAEPFDAVQLDLGAVRRGRG
ncbi:MAG: Uma2 family endonuclease [Polyangiaceae bacterium]